MQEDYEEIVRRWYVRLRPCFLQKLTAQYSALSLADAEDLYQDTFIAVQDNILRGRVKEDTSWNNYIITIGLNLANKRMRHLGKTDSIDKTDDEDTPIPATQRVIDLLKAIPEDEQPLYDDPEAQALLGDELTHTPEPCGSIIRLFYYENLKMDEIAQEIGYKNADTAKAKKNQCMKDLIRRIKESFRKAGLV